MIRIFAIFSTLLTVAGCAMFQPAVRPDAPMALPRHYSLYTADAPGPDRWWQSFGSDELNRLVEEALAGNFDVRAAGLRLRRLPWGFQSC